MYALHARGLVGLASLCAMGVPLFACGSASSDGGSRQGVDYGGFASTTFGASGFPVTGGFGGAATGGIMIVGQGGIIATGGAFPVGGTTGTGGVIDPGPPPTGQMLDCQGTGPCKLDDGDACCIAASVRNGVVTNLTVNCIPPNASCDYPFTIAHCDGPEDCRSSEVCCGTLKPFGDAQIFGDVACVPAGECPGNQKFLVCRPGITQCPAGTNCSPFPTLPVDIQVCH